MLRLLPLSIGVAFYGLVPIVSFDAYEMVLRVMRRPVTAGPEALIHALHVRVQSEQWIATCSESVLVACDIVKVIGRDGLTLQVQPLSKRQVGRFLDIHQSDPAGSE